MHTNRFDLDRDYRTIEGSCGPGRDHGEHSFGDLHRVVENRTGLASGYELSIGLIGAVGEGLGHRSETQLSRLGEEHRTG